MLPSAQRSIMANIFTPSYRILGRIAIGNSGLLGLLNDPSKSFISVYEASMARLHEPKKIADKTDELRLVKRGLVLVGVARAQDVGQSVSRSGYGRVARYAIRVVTGTFELDGQMEWSGRFELEKIMVDTGMFIPLYDATVRAIHYPDLQMGSPAIVFNRNKLDIVRELEQGEGED